MNRRIHSSLFLLIGFLTLNLYSYSQDSLKQVLKIEATTFHLDHLGNFYFIKNETVQKYNSNYKFEYSFSESSLGHISSIDVSNPLRILIFYQESQQIVFLNQQLSKISNTIDLMDYAIYDALLVCQAEMNRIWILDGQENQLRQFDQNFKEVQRSTSLLNLSSTNEVNYDHLELNQKQLFLHVHGEGFLQFDSFGTFLRKITLAPSGPYNWDQQNLIYVDDQKIKSYDLKTHTENIINILSTDLKQIRSNSKTLFFLNSGNLSTVAKEPAKTH